MPALSLELAAGKWKSQSKDGARDRPAAHVVAEPDAAARLRAMLNLIERRKMKWTSDANARVVIGTDAGRVLRGAAKSTK